MQDIFSGELVVCWKDEESVYLSFPWSVAIFPIEEWSRVVTDLKALVISVRETELKELKEE